MPSHARPYLPTVVLIAVLAVTACSPIKPPANAPLASATPTPTAADELLGQASLAVNDGDYAAAIAAYTAAL